MRIDLRDRRYERASCQEFSTFEEGTTFLRDYCRTCRLEEICAITNGLRGAIGDNYPFWNKALAKRSLKVDVEPNERLPDEFIGCRLFKEREKNE